MGHGGAAPPGTINVTDPDDDDGAHKSRAPIGLDAGSGGAHQDPPVPEATVGFAKRKLGHRVGDGECFALADQALKAAKAFSAADFGTITDDADYIWGTQIQLGQLQAGDIIQFRDYRFDLKTTDEDGGWSTQFQERPHHTAVVETVGSDGAVTVLEQNAPKKSPVLRTTLYFQTTTFKRGSKTTEVTVQGTVWYYRPQKRS
jgi:hypothetical protein